MHQRVASRALHRSWSRAFCAVPEEIPDASDPVILYQYETCPFCTKVRMFLYYHKIPFTAIEVDPLRKTELKEIKNEAYGEEKITVPLVYWGGEYHRESDQIIQKLYEHHYPNIPIHASEEKWIQWVDQKLIRYVSPMVYESWSGAFKAFGYINSHSKFPLHTRLLNTVVGGVAMHLITNLKLKKKYNIVDTEGEYQQLLHDWAVYGLEHKDFHGGDSPDLADITVFGVLGAMVRCREDMMDEYLKNEAVRLWFRRMHNEVEHSMQDVELDSESEYETDDEQDPVIKVVSTSEQKREEREVQKQQITEEKAKSLEEGTVEVEEEREKEFARVRSGKKEE